MLDIVAARGKMQNPVTGSGGMLVGVVDEVGPESTLGLHVGDRVATLVSLSLTPLRITDGLAGWDGRSEQVPADGHAILFGRSIAARLPDDLPGRARDGRDGRLRGAGAHRARRPPATGTGAAVAVIGGAGKSGSMSLAAARRAGARTVGVVPVEPRPRCCARSASPTPSRSPTPATRSRWPPRSSRPSAARPT